MFFRSLARASTLCGALVGARAGDPCPCSSRRPTHAHGRARDASNSEHQRSACRHQSARARRDRRRCRTVDHRYRRAADPGERQPGRRPVSDLFPNNGPGRACIIIVNQDFTVGTGQTFTIRLGVSNSRAPATARARCRSRIRSVATIDSSAEGTCATTEHAADRERGCRSNDQRQDGEPGETVTLDGSGSTDPDPDNVLTLHSGSTSPATDRSDRPSTPTLTVTLAPGTHNIRSASTTTPATWRAAATTMRCDHRNGPCADRERGCGSNPR